MPTETVYGLGANAFDPIAVAKVFAAKERPTFDPLIVHIADRADLSRIFAPETLKDRRLDLLADALWPGPLTIVAAASDLVPPLVRAGLATVGVRIPDHPTALALIRAAATPIAAPSANRFGRLSPTRAEHVAADLEGRIDAIIDAGVSKVGVESTVIALEPGAPARLLRPGGVPLERLRELLAPFGGVDVAATVERGDAPLPAPGMSASHYAPRAAMRIASEQRPFAGLDRCALLGTDRADLSKLEAAAKEAGVQIVAALPLSEHFDPIAAAATLFDALHRLDDALAVGGRSDVDARSAIVASPYPVAGLGLAIADRLRRAAATTGTRGVA